MEAKEYYDIIIDNLKRDLYVISKINKKLSPDLEYILARLDYLIQNDISLEEKVLPPYFSGENTILLGDEMEKRFTLRLDKMYSKLPQVYSKIVEYNFPELKKNMRYINIYPFRCNIRYRYGTDFTKKGLILDPLGEASIYFYPISKGESITAMMEKANPDVNESELIKLRMEYTME